MTTDTTIDIQVNKQLQELMEEGYETLLSTYLANARKYVAEIQDGFAQKEFKRVEDAAHPLKSSSGSLGAVKLHKVAKRIEHSAKALSQGISDDAGDIVGYVDEIDTLLDEAEQCLLAEKG